MKIDNVLLYPRLCYQNFYKSKSLPKIQEGFCNSKNDSSSLYNKNYLINYTSKISFGYQNLLKTYWLQGKLPTVKYGIYGGELTSDNITLEHLLPHSKKGRTILSNLALSKNVNNWARGNKPIGDFLNTEAFEQYCAQFKDIKLPYFNGNEYVKEITKTIQRLLERGK